MTLHPGQVLADRYEVEHELGRGGMGMVHQVRHRLLGSAHALKVLSAPLGGPHQARLLAEGRMQARLDHPNLVRVTDVVALDEGVGLVMDLVSGGTLRERLDRRAVPREEALTLGAGILAGVAAAHAARVVHRDLKPENVLLTLDGRPRVADFGIARAPDPSLREGVHTREGVGMGTPGYMAPEAYRDAAHVDARADVFALGALLYELLSGHRTFPPGLSWVESWQLAREARYVPLDQRVPDLPAPLVALVHAALQPERDHRPADAEALAALWARADRSPSWSYRTLSLEQTLAEPAPEGEVALVFSDIEGSSVLWDRHGPSFLPALALHDRLLRTAARQEGGFEVKSEGDSFFFVFSKADAGLRFCVAAQRALQEAEWPAALEEPAKGTPPATEGAFRGLRVRMGMHTGTPERVLNPTTGRADYVGPVVNRAARVAEAAHGGQILLSGPAAEAARLAMGAVEYRDLGLFRLKGLERLERLVQALPADLSGRRFPPPRALPPARARASRFFGRERELRALTDQLRGGSRLVTVLGPGGAGKTRLAEQLLETTTLTAGGSTLALLADAHDRDGLARAVASALGAMPVGVDPIEGLAVALALRGPTLLVLDNAEHLIAAVREAVPRWLAEAPDLRLLVTSQVRLDLEGETVVPLGPLPEAAALLLERGRAVRPDLVEDAALLEAIAERLDRLPLAIELAASRLNVYSLQQLYDRLYDRFRLLRGKNRSERHATLEAAISWSWDLLGSVEQQALSRCAVFRGGFSLEAAEAVLDGLPGPWPDELLAAGVDHSLVRRVDPRPDEPRFALYESVRDFVQARLSDQDRREAGARHRAFFSRLGAPEALDDLQWIDSPVRRRIQWEQENLLAVVETGSAVGDAEPAARAWLAIERGEVVPTPDPSLAPLGETIASQTGLEADTLARLWSAICGVWLRQGEHERAWEAAHRAREAASCASSLEGMLCAQLAMGRLAHVAARPNVDRVGLLSAIVARGRAADLTIWMAADFVLSGWDLWNSDADRARTRLRGILDSPGVDQRVIGCRATLALGQLESDTGAWRQGRELIQRGSAMARRSGSSKLRYTCAIHQGKLELAVGSYEEARRFGTEALEIARTVGSPGNVFVALALLGRTDLQTGRAVVAETAFREARQAALRSGNARRIFNSEYWLADCLAKRNQDDDAESIFRSLGRQTDVYPEAKSWWARGLAPLLARRGAFAEAAEVLAEHSAPDVAGAPLSAFEFLLARAEVSALSGDLATSASALHQAQAILTRLDLPPHAPMPRALADLRERLEKVAPTLVPA